MSERQVLRIYLEGDALPRALAGQHHFFKRLIGAVSAAGWQVSIEESTLASRLLAPTRPGYALYRMEEPTHDRALTARRCYIGAFWNIEASGKRWDWPVAQAPFIPEEIDPAPAARFVANWRKQLFPHSAPVADGEFVFAPLQGMLTEHRSFQSMSPIAMLEATLTRQRLPVLATLHPNESYSGEEMAALAALGRKYPRLTVQRGGSPDALKRCSLVVTENSSMALEGFFFGKPAILFGKVDFHHIAASVPRDGIEAAFAPRPRPAFERYLWWFLRLRAINAGRPECEAHILATLRRHGWPI